MDATEFRYDPYSPEAYSDPLPCYRVLRDHHPVYRLEPYDGWALSRFEDIWEAFRDRENFSEAEGQVFDRERISRKLNGPPAPAPSDPLPIFNDLDPPLHSEMRRVLDPALLPGALHRIEEAVRGEVQHRLDALLPRGRFCANQDLASPVAAFAVCQVTGLDFPDPPRLIGLVNTALAREPGQTGISAAGWQAIAEIHALIEEQVAARRRTSERAATMLDALLAAEVRGKGLTDAEITRQLSTILIGGTESLPKVVAGGLLELAKRPDQRRIAGQGAEAAAKAFEEMVRFCAPAQWFGRTLKRDATIAGQKMQAGQRVFLLVASANRDEREFAAPDEFRADRTMRRVAAFGVGPHFCIGIHIARLLGRLIVAELLARAPDFDADEAAGYRAVSEFQCGWMRLPIEVA